MKSSPFPRDSSRYGKTNPDVLQPALRIRAEPLVIFNPHGESTRRPYQDFLDDRDQDYEQPNGC
jgi:hypothetical protein